MFTGIITDMGSVSSVVKKQDGGHTATITPKNWDCSDIDLGASIACDGCCLTVIDRTSKEFSVDVSPETLALTTLKDWQEGQKINLERALCLGDELGGHMVSGHIDACGKIAAITKDGNGYRLEVKAPKHLMPLIAPKGSVALDGISLTVNEVEGDGFGTMIIPHTWRHTTLGQKKEGDSVNLEVDMLARYVARMMKERPDE